MIYIITFLLGAMFGALVLVAAVVLTHDIEDGE